MHDIVSPREDNRRSSPSHVAPHVEITVPAGEACAVRVSAGQRVAVVNTYGGQVADTWAIEERTGRRLSPAHSRVALGRLRIRPGDELVDDRRQPVLRLASDTSGGWHDTLMPACDPARYRALGAPHGHRSCADNFRHALIAVGAQDFPMSDPLNLFQRVAVSADGDLIVEPSTAPAMSRVELETLRDVLVIVSACPMDLVPISGAARPPRPVMIRVTAGPER